MSEDYYLILAGGVGAAKFIEGLANEVDPELLKIIINTGDDIELFGLTLCPDIDIITYTLAGLIDNNKGWGFKEETFNCLSRLKVFYGFDWFNAGDKDLATHIYRTDLLKKGLTKAEATKRVCEKLGVKSELIPMCNETVETYIKTPQGEMHFEEFFIKHQCQLEILSVEFKGIENSRPVEGVLEYIEKAKRIIVCPSNPIVSIGTIIQVNGIKDALIKAREKIFAISPIIEGATVKGPADKLMKNAGFEVSCVGVAKYYQDFLGNFIVDNKDCNLKPKIEDMGVITHCFDTLMTSLQKKRELARFVLDLN